jgi:hypothetical protein
MATSYPRSSATSLKHLDPKQESENRRTLTRSLIKNFPPSSDTTFTEVVDMKANFAQTEPQGISIFSATHSAKLLQQQINEVTEQSL